MRRRSPPRGDNAMVPDAPVSDEQRQRLAQLLDFAVTPASFLVLEERLRPGYREQRVQFSSLEGDVPAYLLVPAGDGPFPAVAALHQHASQWHLGKSEVVGRAGDPLNAFGPELARAGIAVLAPDAVGFEDRRRSGPGIDARDDDGAQYLNELAYRLVQGRLLATTVLRDAAAGLSALAAHEHVDPTRLGVIGHSYGGNVTLLLAALDERVRFACASGSGATYRRRMAAGTGLEFAHVVPAILDAGDIDDFVALIAPRPLLLVSATEDKYSADADEVVASVAPAWSAAQAADALEHVRYDGGHALTADRVKRILAWTIKRSRPT